MKTIYLCSLVLVLLSLVFFTFFGDSLYELGKPKVDTARATGVVGQKEVFIPIDALFSEKGEDYVYLLQSERGYCRTIYTLSRVGIEVESINNERAMLSLQSRVRTGDRVVINADGIVSDGIRVIVG